MKRKAHPDAPAPDSAAPRGRPSEPAEGDDAVARAARGKARDDAATQGEDADQGGLPYGMQETRVARTRDVPRERDEDTYSEAAIGGLDPDRVPGDDNPQGLQTGRGPLNQNDQGNRQNAEAEELEQVEPDLDPYRSPR